MPGFTPIYGLEYLVGDDYMDTLAAIHQASMETVEAALRGAGAAPAGVTSLLDLTGVVNTVSARVTTLETGRPSAPAVTAITATIGSNTVGSYSPAGYLRARDGLTHLSSIYQIPAAGCAANAVLFTLPTGFRPAGLLPLMLPVDSVGTTPAGPRVMRFDLNSSGQFMPTAACGANSGFYVWLDSVKFPSP